MQFDILIIAPTLTPHHTELPSAKDEVEAIRRWHPTSVALPMDVQPGHVDAMAIASTMGQITYRNLFWFVTGADKDGILLSDGKMPLETLVMLSKFHDIRYAVLNTCDSKRTAEQLSMQCGIDVICHVGEVSDQSALLFATVFSQKLAEVGDFEKAYRDVATIGTDYEYISHEQLEIGVTRGYREERDAQNSLQSELLQVKAGVQEITDLLSGGRYQKFGLVETIERHGKRLDTIEKVVDEIRDQQPRGYISPSVLWALFAVTVFIAMILAWLAFTLANGGAP